jgi:hypothetical protein
MTHEEAAHVLADWLLRTAHRISPPQVREWGEAMQAELAYVQGLWATLTWAGGHRSPYEASDC